MDNAKSGKADAVRPPHFIKPLTPKTNENEGNIEKDEAPNLLADLLSEAVLETESGTTTETIEKIGAETTTTSSKNVVGNTETIVKKNIPKTLPPLSIDLVNSTEDNDKKKNDNNNNNNNNNNIADKTSEPNENIDENAKPVVSAVAIVKGSLLSGSSDSSESSSEESDVDEITVELNNNNNDKVGADNGNEIEEGLEIDVELAKEIALSRAKIVAKHKKEKEKLSAENENDDLKKNITITPPAAATTALDGISISFSIDPPNNNNSKKTEEEEEEEKRKKQQEEVDDFFGIKYQPTVRRQQGTDFENQTHWEREYEKEMQGESIFSNSPEKDDTNNNDGDNDDEFDFDSESDEEEGTTTNNIVVKKTIPTISTETEEARKLRMKKEEEALIKSMKEEMEAVQKKREEKERKRREEAIGIVSDNNNETTDIKASLLKAQREITEKYSNTEKDKEANNDNKNETNDKVIKKKMPEIRLSITEQSGPLEVFNEDEEEEEEEEDMNDSFEHGKIEIGKAITIKAPTPDKVKEVKPEDNTVKKHSHAKSVKEQVLNEFEEDEDDDDDDGTEDKKDPETSLNDDRAIQAAEFDALVSMEKPVVDGAQTTGERLKALGKGKAITYKQGLKEILAASEELEKNRANIVTQTKPTYFKKRSGLMGMFGSKKPKKLNTNLFDERDKIFLMAQLKFNPDNDTHVKIIQGVYRRITGSNRDIPLQARMWMDIGFQTPNPQTDIRGTGVFGLLQMLGFVNSHFDLVYKIHKLSLTETNSFPLMATAFNISGTCLNALRQGALNKVANDNKSIFETVQDFYESTFFAFYHEFQKKTYADKIDSIRNFQPIFQEAMLNSTRKPLEAMDTLAKYLIGQQKQKKEQELQFTNMKAEVKKANDKKQSEFGGV